MPTVAENPLTRSSTSRPLNLRLRADVTFQLQRYQGRDYWLAKDPIALSYYRFEQEEYYLLQLMDGEITPEQIKQRFDVEFAPQKITMQELYQFIGMLYRKCLLVSEMPGQGIELQHRSGKKRTQNLRSSLANVLAVRFKGFDPDRFLTAIVGCTGWIFSWSFFVCVVLLWLGASALVFTQFETLMQKLPAFHEFFAARNWIWLAIVLALTKVAHELGHGIACKKFGGQCHEMGIMLLVLTPCLYCNVSDSWTLPSKWKRALIAAAGMYVELILASLATFVWWFSNPGMINQLALNVVFVSSVSTILFNGNPLLRYDGYYILADLIEIPNLRQKASSVLQSWVTHWMLGIELRPDPFLPTRRKWFLFGYAIAAVVYRWFTVLTIFWFLYALLEPYGFKVIGQTIASFAVWGLVGVPLIQTYRFFSVPGRLGTVKRQRALVSGLAVLAAVVGIMLIPVPLYVYCPFIVQARNSESVYVEMSGIIREIHVSHGDWVRPGQVLLTLENEELDSQLLRLRGRVELNEVELNSLESFVQFAANQSRSTNDLEVARVELEAARADLRQRSQDLQRLKIIAKSAGYVLPPTRTPRQGPESVDLQPWHGYPLEVRNQGCFLESSTLVAKIVPDPEKFEAVLAVDQSDIEYVQSGQSVELLPYASPQSSIVAETQSIASTRMKSVPKSLSSRFGGDLVTTKNDEGIDVPHSTTYQISVPFTRENCNISDGCTGLAKIRAGSQTIGQRLWRMTQKTFRFEL